MVTIFLAHLVPLPIVHITCLSKKKKSIDCFLIQCIGAINTIMETRLLRLCLNLSPVCDFGSGRNSSLNCTRAGQVGVNDVGCSVLIGFADINKSRTCAWPLGPTLEIDASLMGVSFSWRPGQRNREAIVRDQGRANALPIMAKRENHRRRAGQEHIHNTLLPCH